MSWTSLLVGAVHKWTILHSAQARFADGAVSLVTQSMDYAYCINLRCFNHFSTPCSSSATQRQPGTSQHILGILLLALAGKRARTRLCAAMGSVLRLRPLSIPGGRAARAASTNGSLSRVLLSPVACVLDLEPEPEGVGVYSIRIPNEDFVYETE